MGDGPPRGLRLTARISTGGCRKKTWTKSSRTPSTQEMPGMLLKCVICKSHDGVVRCLKCQRPHCGAHHYEGLCPDCDPEHRSRFAEACPERTTTQTTNSGNSQHEQDKQTAVPLLTTMDSRHGPRNQSADSNDSEGNRPPGTPTDEGTADPHLAPHVHDSKMHHAADEGSMDQGTTGHVDDSMAIFCSEANFSPNTEVSMQPTHSEADRLHLLPEDPAHFALWWSQASPLQVWQEVTARSVHGSARSPNAQPSDDISPRPTMSNAYPEPEPTQEDLTEPYRSFECAFCTTRLRRREQELACLCHIFCMGRCPEDGKLHLWVRRTEGRTKIAQSIVRRQLVYNSPLISQHFRAKCPIADCDRSVALWRPTPSLLRGKTQCPHLSVLASKELQFCEGDARTKVRLADLLGRVIPGARTTSKTLTLEKQELLLRLEQAWPHQKLGNQLTSPHFVLHAPPRLTLNQSRIPKHNPIPRRASSHGTCCTCVKRRSSEQLKNCLYCTHQVCGQCDANACACCQQATPAVALLIIDPTGPALLTGRGDQHSAIHVPMELQTVTDSLLETALRALRLTMCHEIRDLQQVHVMARETMTLLQLVSPRQYDITFLTTPMANLVELTREGFTPPLQDVRTRSFQELSLLAIAEETAIPLGDPVRWALSRQSLILSKLQLEPAQPLPYARHLSRTSQYPGMGGGIRNSSALEGLAEQSRHDWCLQFRSAGAEARHDATSETDHLVQCYQQLKEWPFPWHEEYQQMAQRMGWSEDRVKQWFAARRTDDINRSNLWAPAEMHDCGPTCRSMELHRPDDGSHPWPLRSEAERRAWGLQRQLSEASRAQQHLRWFKGLQTRRRAHPSPDASTSQARQNQASDALEEVFDYDMTGHRGVTHSSPPDAQVLRANTQTFPTPAAPRCHRETRQLNKTTNQTQKPAATTHTSPVEPHPGVRIDHLFGGWSAPSVAAPSAPAAQNLLQAIHDEQLEEALADEFQPPGPTLDASFFHAVSEAQPPAALPEAEPNAERTTFFTARGNNVWCAGLAVFASTTHWQDCTVQLQEALDKHIQTDQPPVVCLAQMLRQTLKLGPTAAWLKHIIRSKPSGVQWSAFVAVNDRDKMRVVFDTGAEWPIIRLSCVTEEQWEQRWDCEVTTVGVGGLVNYLYCVAVDIHIRHGNCHYTLTIPAMVAMDNQITRDAELLIDFITILTLVHDIDIEIPTQPVHTYRNLSSLKRAVHAFANYKKDETNGTFRRRLMTVTDDQGEYTPTTHE